MGYDAFIEKNRASSVSSTLRRKSLQMTKSITHSMGESSGNRRAISRSSGFLLAARGALWRLVGVCLRASCVLVLDLNLSHFRAHPPAVTEQHPRVMVISSDGYFYSYIIDLEHGGECQLVKRYRLFDLADMEGGGAGWALM
ncbi:hypothetical protein H2248_011285 [Termitomyces sp. 'cryptogamus']|nr:hypothetical protein H2248_011285 [Termitomyces sp. 'cryptogamus']